MGTLPPAAVLIDVEGTALPHDFVATVLRPFSAAHLLEFVAANRDEPAVSKAVRLIVETVPGQAPEETLAHWLARDFPAAALHSLQALLWRAALDDGRLDDPIFADVGPALRRWAGAGIRLAAYSADSAALQKLLFAHGPGGDLSGLFRGFFDTRLGMKAEPESFSRLAIALAVPPFEVVYVSAIEADLDAAAAAGMRTCQVVRDGSAVSERHPVAVNFPGAAALVGLPAVA